MRYPDTFQTCQVADTEIMTKLAGPNQDYITCMASFDPCSDNRCYMIDIVIVAQKK